MRPRTRARMAESGMVSGGSWRIAAIRQRRLARENGVASARESSLAAKASAGVINIMAWRQAYQRRRRNGGGGGAVSGIVKAAMAAWRQRKGSGGGINRSGGVIGGENRRAQISMKSKKMAARAASRIAALRNNVDGIARGAARWRQSAASMAAISRSALKRAARMLAP